MTTQRQHWLGDGFCIVGRALTTSLLSAKSYLREWLRFERERGRKSERKKERERERERKRERERVRERKRVRERWRKSE